MVMREQYDAKYAEWCVKQGGYVTARQNHTDAAVMSVPKISTESKEHVGLSQKYDEARADELDDRLSKIEKDWPRSHW